MNLKVNKESMQETAAYRYVSYAVDSQYLSGIEEKINELLTKNRGYELYDIKYNSHVYLDRSDNKREYYSALIIFKIPENRKEQVIPDF